MTRTRSIVTASAATLALSLVIPAFAFQTDPTAPPPRPGQPPTPPATGQPPRPERPQTKPAADHAELLRASQVTGLKVMNDKGENLGKIENIAVELESGKIRYAVLSFGGFLNMGDKLFAIPWDSLDFAHGRELIRISNLDRAALESAPGFDKNDWPDFADETWGSEVHRHYKNQPYWEEEKGKELRGGAKVECPEDTRPDMPERKVERTIARVSELSGLDVTSPDRKALGEVKELMIDLDGGEVVFAVLSLDKLPDAKHDHLYVTPWRTVGLRMPVKMGDQIVMVVNVDETRIAPMPSFHENAWPNMHSDEWMTRVHAYYGPEEDWVYGYTGPEGAPPTTPPATPPTRPRTPATTPPPTTGDDPYVRYFESADVETIKGRITKIDRGADAVTITIANDAGKQHSVRLGPASYIDQQTFTLTSGAEVTVISVPATVDGKQVMIARQVDSNGKTLKLRNDRGQPLWKSTPGR